MWHRTPCHVPVLPLSHVPTPDPQFLTPNSSPSIPHPQLLTLNSSPSIPHPHRILVPVFYSHFLSHPSMSFIVPMTSCFQLNQLLPCRPLLLCPPQILSGERRGRRLLSPSDRNVRPMMEVVRGAVFSIIQSVMACPGSFPSTARWLDLYSGTGSVGLESLSRGCAVAHFVEMDPWVVASVLGPNLAACGYEDRSVVHTLGVERFLDMCERNGGEGRGGVGGVKVKGMGCTEGCRVSTTGDAGERRDGMRRLVEKGESAAQCLKTLLLSSTPLLALLSFTKRAVSGIVGRQGDTEHMALCHMPLLLLLLPHCSLVSLFLPSNSPLHCACAAERVGGTFDFISVTPPYQVVDYADLMRQLARSPLVSPSSTCMLVEYPLEVRQLVPRTCGPLQLVRDRR